MSDVTSEDLAGSPDENSSVPEEDAPPAPDTSGVRVDGATRHVAALLREREGYAVHGRDDKVAEVDEQLAIHGYETAALKPKAEKRTRK